MQYVEHDQPHAVRHKKPVTRTCVHSRVLVFSFSYNMTTAVLLACRSRQASIVLERYFRFEISLLSILCMLIARMEMGTSRVSGDSDIFT